MTDPNTTTIGTDKPSATTNVNSIDDNSDNTEAFTSGADTAENHTGNAYRERQPLVFDTDRGAWRARFIAALLIIAIVGWMGSDYIFPSDAPVAEVAEEPNEKPATVIPPVAVMVTDLSARTITKHFRAEGQALPDRDTNILAETSGEIAKVLVQKGDAVEAGQLIAKFDTVKMDAEIEKVQQALSQAQRDFDNAQQLLNKGVSTVDRLTTARSRLAAVKSDLTSAEESLKNADIRAPFPGRLESLSINTGEFINAGTPVSRIVDNSPLTIAIQVPQQALSQLSVGQPAEVNFITGAAASGTVSFISTNADAETRTFLAEVTVDNADQTIPAGISAELRIPTQQVDAHFISPAILSLNVDGTLGIKAIDANNQVAFLPIRIEQSQTDGLWVSGLPEQITVITVGQGFVSKGDIVSPQHQTAIDSGLATASTADQETQ